MRTVKILKAQSITKEPVENVIIRIEDEAPNYQNLHSQHVQFSVQAALLEVALYYSQPGGLYDQLLGAMLQRKIVPSFRFLW